MQLRQNELEAKMTKAQTYGQENYCAHCWACMYGEECFALPQNRAAVNLCAKAEKRMYERGFAPLPKKRADQPMRELKGRGKM